jgi:hypothetical protein
MEQVTIYRHNDLSARFTMWADESKATAKELTPEGAEIIVYTKLPTELVEYLLEATKENVSRALNDYLP